jgi:hypothetical protein
VARRHRRGGARGGGTDTVAADIRRVDAQVAASRAAGYDGHMEPVDLRAHSILPTGATRAETRILADVQSKLERRGFDLVDSQDGHAMVVTDRGSHLLADPAVAAHVADVTRWVEAQLAAGNQLSGTCSFRSAQAVVERLADRRYTMTRPTTGILADSEFHDVAGGEIKLSSGETIYIAFDPTARPYVLGARTDSGRPKATRRRLRRRERAPAPRDAEGVLRGARRGAETVTLEVRRTLEHEADVAHRHDDQVPPVEPSGPEARRRQPELAADALADVPVVRDLDPAIAGDQRT